MIRKIEAQALSDAIRALCIQANTRLPDDIAAALDRRRGSEPWPLARETLDLLWDNTELAQSRNLPICQDTGSVWVCLELGEQNALPANVFAEVDQAVAAQIPLAVEYYGQTGVEKSIVLDQRQYELLVVVVVAEYGGIRGKLYRSAVGLVGIEYVGLIHDLPGAVLHPFRFSVAYALDQEVARQCVDSLYAHAVQSDRFLKRLGIVFRAGVHLR